MFNILNMLNKNIITSKNNVNFYKYIKYSNNLFKYTYSINLINYKSNFLNKTTYSLESNSFYGINRNFKFYFNFLTNLIWSKYNFLILSNNNSLFFKLWTAFNFIFFNISYKWIYIFINLNNYFKYITSTYFNMLLKYIKINSIKSVIVISNKLSYYLHETLELSGLVVWSVSKNNSSTFKQSNLGVTLLSNLNLVKFFNIYLINIFFYVKKLYLLNLIKNYIFYKKNLVITNILH